MGFEEPEYIESLKLSEGEDIDQISCSYSVKGIHTLAFKTTAGEFSFSINIIILGQHLLAESEIEDEGDKKVELNFRDSEKAIIGFRTGFNKFMEYL
jgi:hypothetical protein